MSPCPVNPHGGMERGIGMSPCPVNLREGMEGISVCLPVLLTSMVEWYVSLSC